jgi:hypothetical protein
MVEPMGIDPDTRGDEKVRDTTVDALLRQIRHPSRESADAWARASTVILMDALGSASDSDEQARLLSVLRTRYDDAAVPAVTPFVLSPHQRVRFEVADALIAIASPLAAQVIREQLERPVDPALLGVFARAAGFCRAHQAEPFLQRIIGPGYPELVRLNALEAIELLHAGGTIDAVRAQIGDSSSLAVAAETKRVAATLSLPAPWPIGSDIVSVEPSRALWRYGHATGLETRVFSDGTILGIDHRRRMTASSAEPATTLTTLGSLKAADVVDTLLGFTSSGLARVRRFIGRMDDVPLPAVLIEAGARND